MIIVDLGTLFPGLRELFLRSKCMRDAQSSLIYVSSLEDRTEATEWGFWQALAATYLSDTTIAHILEKRNAEEWGDWEKQSAGTCTLHHLLNQYNVKCVIIFLRCQSVLMARMKSFGIHESALCAIRRQCSRIA
jgi:hypothetical protein